jgi:hypothetical protein
VNQSGEAARRFPLLAIGSRPSCVDIRLTPFERPDMSTHCASSSHRPCPACGFAADDAHHVCDPERALERRMLDLRAEIDGFEREFSTYLETAHGVFAQWLAVRKRTLS